MKKQNPLLPDDGEWSVWDQIVADLLVCYDQPEPAPAVQPAPPQRKPVRRRRRSAA